MAYFFIGYLLLIQEKNVLLHSNTKDFEVYDMKKVVLHHTCKQDGGESYVLEKAPFFAKDSQQENKYQFLGSGYYLWEDDEEQAHHWGKVHYNNSYYIVEFVCAIDENYLLDLNSREGQKEFSSLIKIFQEKAKQLNRNTNVIYLNAFFNTLFKGKTGIKFVYKAIKVKDNKASLRREKEYKFTRDKDNTTCLGGVYFYFFKRKEDMEVTDKRIVR